MSHHPRHAAPTPARAGRPATSHPPAVVREPLAVGDRVRTLHVGRTGTVMKVYPDGSVCITWDDHPPPLSLGHERVPRSRLMVFGSTATESEGGEV